MIRQLICFLVFLVTSSGVEKCLAQTPKLDSLKLALKNLPTGHAGAKYDAKRCDLLSALIEAENDDAIWPKYNEQLKNISESNLRQLSHLHPQYKVYKKYFAGSLNNLGYIYTSQGDLPKALKHFSKSLIIQKEMENKPEIANSLNNIAFIYQTQGDIPRALECFNKSIKIQEEIGDKKGIANSSNNIGTIYQSRGDIHRALEYFGKSFKIREEAGDKNGIANSLNNIGTVYQSQGDIPKALEYFAKSVKILEEIGDKNRIAVSLNNIGIIYAFLGDPSVTSSIEDARKAGISKALDYYGKSIKIWEEIGDKNGIAASLNCIGGIYETQGDISKALEYFNKNLKIMEEIRDKKGIATSLNNVGDIYLKQKKYSKALELFSRAMKLSKELGFPGNIKRSADALSVVYKATGNHKLALENYELFIQMRDSITNESTRNASIKNQLKYEYEKQAAADSVAHGKESEIKNVELKRQQAEIKAKKNQQYALFGGLFLVILFAIFMFNRFKVTQKQKVVIEHQKEIVEEQKKLVEEKQKEVLDSIHYAKRIQTAHLANEKTITKNLTRLKRS